MLSPLSVLKELCNRIVHIKTVFLGEIKTFPRMDNDGPKFEIWSLHSEEQMCYVTA